MQPREEYSRILADIKTFCARHVDKYGNIPGRGRRPQVCDVEVMALSVMQSVRRCESEVEFFRHQQEWMPEIALALGSRRNYNGRRRKLTQVTEEIRRDMARETDKDEPAVYALDSMPLPVCRISRAARCRICREDESCVPDHGYCASQQSYFFGYKLHGMCSPTGVIHSFDLSRGGMHDIHYLGELKEMFENCVIIGDKGYVSKEVRLDLFEYARIELVVPYRCNQKEYKSTPHIFRRIRKRIEPDFFQLVDILDIRHNYAKSRKGLFARVTSKVMAFTLLQYENHMAGKPVSQIKSSPLIA